MIMSHHNVDKQPVCNSTQPAASAFRQRASALAAVKALLRGWMCVCVCVCNRSNKKKPCAIGRTVYLLCRRAEPISSRAGKLKNKIHPPARSTPSTLFHHQHTTPVGWTPHFHIGKRWTKGKPASCEGRLFTLLLLSRLEAFN